MYLMIADFLSYGSYNKISPVTSNSLVLPSGLVFVIIGLLEQLLSLNTIVFSHGLLVSV